MTGAQQVRHLSDETWQAYLRRSPELALRAGQPIERLGRGTLAEAEAIAGDASARLARLRQVDTSGFDRRQRIEHAHLAYWLDDEAREADRWWQGFGVTPYSISGLSILPGIVLPTIAVGVARELERYTALVEELIASVEALADRTRAQAERGWRVPRPALAGVRATIAAVSANLAQAIVPGKDRGAPQTLVDALQMLIDQRLRPATSALLGIFDDAYAAASPSEPGICHQPGGEQAYRGWIRYHLGRDMDPDAIHRRGIEEVERLADAMAQVRRDRFGFYGDEAAFHTQLRADPRARAATPDALVQTYQRHLARMAQVFPTLIDQAPRSRPRVERLAPELEAGMTFGYYEAPSQPGADGIYRYSANGIPDRLQLNAAPLIFHELMPGHHVHIARQSENEGLSDLRRHTFPISAFNEGWAEYAAGLADEAGLYDDSYDLYGWLMHQRFVAQRLVVDTGLNAFGWPMERARAFMAANTIEKPEQIESELLRYSSDWPAQALSYRMGFLAFRDLRRNARDRLGNSFELRAFHEAILGEGSLPLEVLEVSIADWAAERDIAHG